jgi:CheY-like chemotaxis protein
MSPFDPLRTVLSVTDVILMVEDEPIYRNRYRRNALERGYRVEVRSSRTDALKCLSTYTPSVAILDLSLKDGDRTKIALIFQAQGAPSVRAEVPTISPKTSERHLWVQKQYKHGELLRAASKARGSALFIQKMGAQP